MMVFPRYAIKASTGTFKNIYRVEITSRNELYELFDDPEEILTLTLYNKDGTILNVDNVIDVEIL